MTNRTSVPLFTTEAFNQLVIEALESLPEDIKAFLNNVDVVVSDWPTAAELRSVGVKSPSQLLGLYQGVPLTRRTSHYGLVLPDKITIFKRPIEQLCRTEERVIKQVRRTVVHELAHHFGISDARLRELGAY
jgi:predicted Zn-dependent protease with MMP-like domain